MPYTGLDGNVWNNVSGQSSGAVDAYGGQAKPTAVDYYRAYQDIVFACIKTICDTMAANPPKLFKEKGSTNSKKYKAVRTKSAEALGQDVEEVTDGDLIELLRSPNPRHTWHQILWAWEQQRHLFGSGYLHKESSMFDPDSQTPTRLWIRPSANTSPRLAPNGVDIEHYRSGQMEIEPSKIIALDFIDPLSVYGKGVSPVQSCWASLTLKQKHESFLANAYDSNGVPSAIATPIGDADPDADAQRTLLMDFKEWHTRRKNGGLLIPPKDYEFTFPPPPVKEIVGKVDELTYIKNAVASAFGIPFALFEVAVGNRATLDASLTQFMMLAILPRIRERDEALTKQLARLYDDGFFFRTDSPLPADDEKKNAQFELLGKFGAVTKNEIRAAYAELKLDQRPEFEESPTAPPRPSPDTVSFDDALPDAVLAAMEDEAVVGSGVTPADVENNPSLPSKINMYQLLALQQAVYEGKIPRDAAIAQLVILFGITESDAQKLISQSVPVSTIAPEPAPVKKVKGVKKNPRKELASILKAFFEKQHEEVLKSIPASGIKAAAKVHVGFDLAQANAELFSETFPTINLIAQQSIKKTLIKVKASQEDYITISHKLKPTIRKMVLEFANSTNQTTQLDIQTAYQKVKDSIEEGIDEASTLESIRKEIGNIYQGAADHRTYAIANTETARAFAISDQHAAKESGVVKGKMFLISNNACDVCQKAAGKYRDKVMPIDHEWFDNPYSKGLLGHPNCKCSQTYVLKDEYN